MSTTPHIQSIKRTRFESDTTPAPAQKRVKRESETPTTTTSSRKRQTKQQTLTQIDFLRSSGSKGIEDADDNDLSELEPLPNPHDNAKRSFRRQSRTPTVQRRSKSSTRARAVKKRDSTLTQMDFFHSGLEDDDGVKLDDTTISEGNNNDELATAIPALDGPADTPAKSSRNGRNASSAKRRARNATESVLSVESKSLDDGQQRRKRRKLDNVHVAHVDKEWKLGRSMLVPTPEEDTSRVRRTTRSTKQPLLQNQENVLSRSPILEIQETKSTTEWSLETERSTVTFPVTPIKSRDRVPSSQTPESIIPSTKKSRRRPLAEKSANIQISPVKPMKTPPVKLRSQPSPKRKICVLKVPSGAHLPHSTRVEDRHHDMWSIQATSSLSEKENSSGQDSAMEGHEIMETPSEASILARQPEQSWDILNPLTTPRRFVNDQMSLPGAVVASGGAGASVMNASQGANGSSAADVVLPRQTSFIDSTNCMSNTVVCDQDPVNMIPEYSEITTDELSDLGSPVPNETQFVRDLLERISSPVPKSHGESFHQQRPRSATSTASLPVPSLCRTPIPTPRLVQTSPFRMTGAWESSKSTASSTTNLSAGVRPLLQHGSSNVRITRVPLNDTNSYTEWKNLSSSSPLLPPQPKPDSMTQKSIHPASMPHPSQISTQAPSQLYIPTSSAPKSLTDHDSEVERITIKDSSSVSRRSSQYRRYTDGDGENKMIEIGDSEQEDDLDIDLDPASLQQAAPLRYRRQGGRVVTQETTYTQAPEPEDDDMTQTPTQKIRDRGSLLQRRTTTQSSPIIITATTRSQRNAMLEVIALPSSSPPEAAAEVEIDTHQAANNNILDDQMTPRPLRQLRSSSNPTFNSQHGKTVDQAPSRGNNRQAQQARQPQTRSEPPPVQHSRSSPAPSASSSLGSLPSPRPLKRRYSPIPGFNNDTQADLTQNGHVSAAYVHRMREDGLLPDWFVPKPHKPPNWRKGDSRNLLGSYAGKGKKKK